MKNSVSIVINHDNGESYLIDFKDRSYIRWVYYNKIKSKYMITSDGLVLSIRNAGIKFIKGQIDKDGYLRVTLRLNGKPRYLSVHRLIAEAFIPNPDNKPQVNHKDGVKSHNYVDNLEWATVKENIVHAWSHGLAKSKLCEDHPNSVYSNSQIHSVCKYLVENKLTMKEISNITDVTYTVVKQIRNHIIWKHISDLYDFSNYNISGRSIRR